RSRSTRRALFWLSPITCSASFGDQLPARTRIHRLELVVTLPWISGGKRLDLPLQDTYEKPGHRVRLQANALTSVVVMNHHPLACRASGEPEVIVAVLVFSPGKEATRRRVVGVWEPLGVGLLTLPINVANAFCSFQQVDPLGCGKRVVNH